MMRVERRLRGEGEFILTNGNRVPSGPVQIKQYFSGRTLLCCNQSTPIRMLAQFESITGFQGKTTKGQPIQTPRGIQFLFSNAEQICFNATRVEIGKQSTGADTHELSLTNLRFDKDVPQAIALGVEYGDAPIRVRLIPRRNYAARTRYLGVTEDIVSTAKLQFCAEVAPSEFITDFCTALSVVQGRRINWIHHGTYSKRKVQHAQFGQTITKPYTGQPLCFNPDTRTGVQLKINTVTEVLPAIKEFRETFDPDRRIINHWLDARTEIDYLEARTLKYVVVIEALNAITLQTNRSILKTVVDSKIWRKLYPKVVASLQSEAIASKVLTLQNWQRINLSSFKETLVAVCNRHQITVSKSDLGSFSRIRNDMVHRLRYDLSIQLPAPWDMLDRQQVALHYFVADFVDRIVLQLFGLGSYLESTS